LSEVQFTLGLEGSVNVKDKYITFTNKFLSSVVVVTALKALVEKYGSAIRSSVNTTLSLSKQHYNKLAYQDIKKPCGFEGCNYSTAEAGNLKRHQKKHIGK
jgi:hypothetical protein